MITLEESLALLKEIQDKAQEKLAQMPRKEVSDAEWEALVAKLAKISQEDLDQMTQAINEAFPINYLERDEDQ
jgi:primosomal protein N''